MGINQIWTPPRAVSDGWSTAWQSNPVSLLDDPDSNEVSSSRADCVSTMQYTNWWKVDRRGRYSTHLFAAHQQFRTSSSTQHVERGWCPDIPDRLVLHNCYQHDSASEHDPGGHDGQGERTGAPWAPVTHIHQPAGVKGLKLTSVTEIYGVRS